MDLLVAAQLPDSSPPTSPSLPNGQFNAARMAQSTDGPRAETRPNSTNLSIPSTPTAPKPRPVNHTKKSPMSKAASGGSAANFNQGVGGNHNNRVCLLNLVTSGLLRPHSSVSFRNHTAIVTPAGKLQPNPTEPLSQEMQPEYETPSAWATAVCKMGRHGRVAVNGWSSVKIQVACDTEVGPAQHLEVPLDVLRQKYLAMTSGNPAMANLPLRHFLGDSRKRKLRPDTPSTGIKNRKVADGSSEPSDFHRSPSVPSTGPSSPANIPGAIAASVPTPPEIRPPAKRKYTRHPKFPPALERPLGGWPPPIKLSPIDEPIMLEPLDSTNPAEMAKRSLAQKLRNKRRKKLNMRIYAWLDYRRSTRGVPWAFPLLRRAQVTQYLKNPESQPGPTSIFLPYSRRALPSPSDYVCRTETSLDSKLNCDRTCTTCGLGIPAAGPARSAHSAGAHSRGSNPASSAATQFPNLFHCKYCGEDYHATCAGHDVPSSAHPLVPHIAPPPAAARKLPDLGSKQCANCASCMTCHQREPAGQLLQCDHCPQLTHVPCLPPIALEAVQQYRRWVCPDCARCHECGSRDPNGPEPVPPDGKAYWSFDYSLCGPCGKLLEKGNLCPLCQSVYRDDDYETPMIACDTCSHWVHSNCDAYLTPERYQRLVEDEDSQYFCPICRKEQEETMFWTLPVAFERERVWVAAIGGLRASFRHELRDQLSPKTGRGASAKSTGSGATNATLSVEMRSSPKSLPATGSNSLGGSPGMSAVLEGISCFNFELDIHPLYDLGLTHPPSSIAEGTAATRIRRVGSLDNGDSPRTPGLCDLLLAAAHPAHPARGAKIGSLSMGGGGPIPPSLSAGHTPISSSFAGSGRTRPSSGLPVSATNGIPHSSAMARHSTVGVGCSSINNTNNPIINPVGGPPPCHASVVDAAEVLLTLFSAEPSPSPSVSVPPASAHSNPHLSQR
ncbi:hypothetical protein BJ085DRAFT_40285 [Dimargaris cristalligena]|uniref:PHD-type domain-containing protein n=1 Tax=Dimargaris cristalligena TaxID=215637 RepID=A0A4V1J3X9_9FUNG|nr:hypothetical protein BJ085DRAFT_40285 [Dimargaris cristalligena]|eukprot:RKP33619.1 hypothetical protein BJ085DRAFT_40285 [Dimargaris cristalligena]